MWTLYGDRWNKEGSNSQEPISRAQVGGWKPSCRREVFEPRKLELNQKACSLDAIELDNICKMFLATNPILLEMGCISVGAFQGQGRFSYNGL